MVRKGELQTQVADLCKPRLQTFANPGCRLLQTQAADRVNLQQGHVGCQKGGVLKVLQAVAVSIEALKKKLGGISNSYTMGCPPVRGLSYVQVDKHGITIVCHLHQCRPCTSSDIPC